MTFVTSQPRFWLELKAIDDVTLGGNIYILRKGTGWFVLTQLYNLVGVASPISHGVCIPASHLKHYLSWHCHTIVQSL